jgi:pimeloyl-ACP methyl ester carboxylesterase
VLVHGAFHDGRCWDRVVPLLVARGLAVSVPTLTGAGDRAHLLSPQVGLSTHVEDVVAHLRHADLDDVLLVGHSYAGLVVREAADRVPERVAAVGLVDAWVGLDGASLASLAPDWFTDALRVATDRDGFGWLCPPPPPELVGVTDPDDAAWLVPRLGPHPFRTFVDPTRLSGRVDALPHHAAVCAEGLGLPFAAMAAGVGCPEPTVLPTGHDAMVTAPAALADFLATAAGADAAVGAAAAGA